MGAIPQRQYHTVNSRLRGDRGYDPLLQDTNDTTCRSAPWARFPQCLHHTVNFDCVVIAGMTRSYKTRTTPPVGAPHGRDFHNACTTP